MTRQQQFRHMQLDWMIKSYLDRLVLSIHESEWVQLSELAETRYGTSVSADASVESGAPVLRIPNVMGGEVDTADMKYVELSLAELERLRLKLSDVLIVRSNGNPEYVGRSAPITPDVEEAGMVYASYLIRLRANRERILPEYLSSFLNSAFGRAAMRNAIRTTAGQSNLSGENLVKVRIPLPALAEQNRFASFWRDLRLLRQLFAWSERLTTDLQTEITALALSGELTDEWRKAHQHEIAESAQGRDEELRKRGARFSLPLPEVAQHKLQSDTNRPARRWLIDELSEFQKRVFEAFITYPRQPLLAEDPDVFGAFCSYDLLTTRLAGLLSSPIRIRRTLGQLSALGLIAKITVPKTDLRTGEREYLKAFRPLRDDENTRLADVEMLRRLLSPGDQKPLHRFEVTLDYELAKRSGVEGKFQVFSLTDDGGNDRANLVAQGRSFGAVEELLSDIAEALGVKPSQIELKVVERGG